MVRLPCSAPLRYVRDFRAYARVLTRVDPHADYASGFEGCLLRPASLVREAALPDPAVLLECAGPVRRGSGHRRAPSLYVLWRFDRRRGEWCELARTQAEAWEWAVDLRGPAMRALGQVQARAAAVQVRDLEARLERFGCVLDEELAGLPHRQQPLFLAGLADWVAARLADFCQVGKGGRKSKEERALERWAGAGGRRVGRVFRTPGISRGLAARPGARQGR